MITKESFKNLIKDGNSETGTWKEQEWSDALKKWCEKNLVLKSAENQEKVEKYCIKPPLTIKERIERCGKRVVTDWDDEKLERMLQSDFQFFTDFAFATGTVLNRFNKSEFKAALIQWCTSNIKIELNHTNANDIWTKVQARCLDS
ncbi:hypothetical protein A6V39_00495 [Candidatus Mycoplasma haematobovis]|uniref:Uncharacterized protein n=1 Tax=Candidatus Mycoplasma haematobovis TaxID=432608 RepID=A0A1A9QFP1_9MOLU|nr:hypothetical protein [Candidatus Mycoplasma haematobovis]OAL10529.1 hypothetical protein A6V39_00495 [Candidatus Mycoplasma haematobovis]